MSLNLIDQAQCRFYLESWARWLLSPTSGWNHRSPSDRWKEQVSLGHSGFHSQIPHGVEPGLIARQASITLRELRELDGRSAGIIEAVYLRRNSTSMAAVAEQLGITTAGLNTRRKRAELAFYSLLRSRIPEDN